MNFDLASQLGPVSGTLLAARCVIGTVSAKAEAWRATQADAVDIETAAVLDVAEGLPIAVLRAVCDPAEQNLPAAALNALTARGRIDVGSVMWSVARRPGQIGGLIALGRDAGMARKALLDRVQTVGPLKDVPIGG